MVKCFSWTSFITTQILTAFVAALFLPVNLYALETAELGPTVPFYVFVLVAFFSALLTVIINYFVLVRSLKKNITALHAQSIECHNEAAITQQDLSIKEAALSFHSDNNEDLLTKLPNRKQLFDFLNYLTISKSTTAAKYAIFILNLDFFRSVNNNLGHEVGDKILIEFADRLKGLFPDNTFIARMDGDEFALVMKISGTADIDSAAGRILEAMKKPVLLFGQEIYLSVSIGVSILPDQGNTTVDLIRNAAAAVNEVKSTRRSSYKIYSPNFTEYNHQKFNIHSELRHALDHEEFILHYQPKVDGKTSQIVGIEALIRWNHPSRGLLYPIDFIPIAEETGIIKYIDEWVLKTACTQLKRWMQEGISNIRLAVNLSAWQFKDQHLVETVAKVLKETEIAPTSLELEITETVAIENMNFTQNTLTKLMDMGIKISIDDFGTGYSSLNYLKHFPASFLKIDKSFVADILDDSNTYSIVRAIIEVAHALQLKVIAEGVENQEQLNALKDLNCDEIQGYLISKPLDVENIVEHIKHMT